MRGKQKLFVGRGGCWDDDQRLARCASRFRLEPVSFNGGLGLRLKLKDDSKARRVVRGGSWVTTQWYGRCAYRGRDEPDSFGYNLGFRLKLNQRGGNEN